MSTASAPAPYRAIVESMDEPISLAERDGTLVYVNPAYARFFGLDVVVLEGSNLFERVPPEDRATVRALVDRVWTEGAVVHSENRNVGSDGRVRWFAWTNSMLHDGTGRVLLQSVARDITERKAAEAALRESQSFVQRTERTAGVGGWQLEIASGRIAWSEQTRRIHEVADDYQPTLDAAVRFYAPEARALIEAAVRRGIAQAVPWDLELPFVTARGRHTWVRAVGEVEFEAGQPVRLVGAFQDIGERRALQQRLAEREAFLRQITDVLPARVAYIDRELRFRFASRLMCEQFGLPFEQVIGRTRGELAGPRPEMQPHEQAALAGVEQRFEFDELLAGESRRFECRFVPHRDAAGVVQGFVSISLDISARSAGEQRLRELSSMLRSVAESIPAAVAVVGADQRYRFVNSAFERWAGIGREQVIGRTVQEVIGEDDRQRSQPWIERALAGETVHFEREYLALGRPRHLSVSYAPLRGDRPEGAGAAAGLADAAASSGAAAAPAVAGFVATLLDISEQRIEQVRLLQMTQLDTLTGLLNRSGLESALAQRLQSGQGAALALLYIDLDRFKPVNDRHGHPVGDAVLQQVGQRLKRLVRPTDAVARLGGDEFVVLLSGVHEAAHAQGVADKVVHSLQQPFEVGPLRASIGASVGVAVGVPPGGDGATLLARADALLYRAKGAGRGRAVVEAAAGGAQGNGA